MASLNNYYFSFKFRILHYTKWADSIKLHDLLSDLPHARTIYPLRSSKQIQTNLKNGFAESQRSSITHPQVKYRAPRVQREEKQTASRTTAFLSRELAYTCARESKNLSPRSIDENHPCLYNRTKKKTPHRTNSIKSQPSSLYISRASSKWSPANTACTARALKCTSSLCTYADVLCTCSALLHLIPGSASTSWPRCTSIVRGPGNRIALRCTAPRKISD